MQWLVPRVTMRATDLHIAEPCHEPWDEMHGDDATRFCGTCTKHVHDLSAMTETAAKALIERHRGESLCVRYRCDTGGRIHFDGGEADLVPAPRVRRRTAERPLAVAPMLVAALAACTPHGPADQQAQSIVVDEPPLAQTVAGGISIPELDPKPCPPPREPIAQPPRPEAEQRLLGRVQMPVKGKIAIEPSEEPPTTEIREFMGDVTF